MTRFFSHLESERHGIPATVKCLQLPPDPDTISAVYTIDIDFVDQPHRIVLIVGVGTGNTVIVEVVKQRNTVSIRSAVCD